MRPRRKRWPALPAGLAVAAAGAAWLTWCAVGAGPWGVAQPVPIPQPRPAPGVLLLSADDRDAGVLVAESVRIVGPLALGRVRIVRGDRIGLHPLAVECTPAGGDAQLGDHAMRWRPGGRDLADLLGQAACLGHPLMRHGAAGGAT